MSVTQMADLPTMTREHVRVADIAAQVELADAVVSADYRRLCEILSLVRALADKTHMVVEICPACQGEGYGWVMDNRGNEAKYDCDRCDKRGWLSRIPVARQILADGYLIVAPDRPTPEEYERGARLIPSMLDEGVRVWRVPPLAQWISTPEPQHA